jgi:threonyl-tRNA synthetase
MGDKESTSESVSVRTRGKGDEGGVALADFITRAVTLANRRGVEL